MVYVPGAKIERITKEIKYYESKYEIKKLIVHVGGNHITEDGNNAIMNKLEDMLIEIKRILPRTKILYSLILPRIDSSYLPSINWINSERTKFCEGNGILIIKHESFQHNKNINRNLFKWDLVHPNEKGTTIFAMDLIYGYRNYGNRR